MYANVINRNVDSVRILADHIEKITATKSPYWGMFLSCLPITRLGYVGLFCSENLYGQTMSPKDYIRDLHKNDRPLSFQQERVSTISDIYGLYLMDGYNYKDNDAVPPELIEDLTFLLGRHGVFGDRTIDPMANFEEGLNRWRAAEKRYGELLDKMLSATLEDADERKRLVETLIAPEHFNLFSVLYSTITA